MDVMLSLVCRGSCISLALLFSFSRIAWLIHVVYIRSIGRSSGSGNTGWICACKQKGLFGLSPNPKANDSALLSAPPPRPVSEQCVIRAVPASYGRCVYSDRNYLRMKFSCCFLVYAPCMHFNPLQARRRRLATRRRGD